MYILELCHNKLALVGHRVHIFQLNRKIDYGSATDRREKLGTKMYDRRAAMN